MTPVPRIPDAVIRAATPEDIAAVYGRRNDATVRAWALEWRGRVVGVAGVAGNHVMFSDIVPDLPPLLIARAARTFRDVAAAALRRPVVAFTDNPALLTWLGFEGPRMIDGRPGYVFDPRKVASC